MKFASKLGLITSSVILAAVSSCALADSNRMNTITVTKDSAAIDNHSYVVAFKLVPKHSSTETFGTFLYPYNTQIMIDYAKNSGKNLRDVKYIQLQSITIPNAATWNFADGGPCAVADLTRSTISNIKIALDGNKVTCTPIG